MPWQPGNHCPLETLIQVQRFLVVVQVIGENRQGQLRRAAAAITPLKFGGAMASQIPTETKRPSVNRDFGGRESSPARVGFHRTPPSSCCISSAVNLSGCCPSSAKT